jgi:RND family efflux transporter MFP subunit
MSELVAIAAPPRAGHGLRRWLLIGLALLVAGFIAGLVPRLALRHRLASAAQSERARRPAVTTARPQRAPAVAELPLPGSTEAFLVTSVYARTNGYLVSRAVDIGDHVTSGQLLAEIDTPEIDDQLTQAQATLAEAEADVVKLRADLALARTTLQRYLVAGVGSVSKQQIDERSAAVTDAQKAVDAGEATVAANRADVERLENLQGFQRVYAPFDGVITARNVDPGSLISAGSTQGTTELFRIAQVDTLRIFVFVPQTNAMDVHVGQTAEVTLRELPGRVFTGTVTRTAGAIDPGSRTLLTEVQVPNRDGALLAGSYVTVTFHLPRSAPPLLIPSTALVVDARGVRVGVVGADGVLHYRTIGIGRDYGDRVEVLEGLTPDDTVALGVPGGLADGTAVDAAPLPTPGSS